MSTNFVFSFEMSCFSSFSDFRNLSHAITVNIVLVNDHCGTVEIEDYLRVYYHSDSFILWKAIAMKENEGTWCGQNLASQTSIDV